MEPPDHRMSPAIWSRGTLSNDAFCATRCARGVLDEEWSVLDLAAWDVEVVEPKDNPDLGPIRLERLPLLRLTEVEVHGTDLGLNLGDWSELFISTVLPMRIESLNIRRNNHRAFDTELEGSWLLVADDGPTYKVTVDGTKVESRPASPQSQARAVIET